MTLLRTLYFNGKFSSRPLVHFANHLNETVVRQIHRDGFVYAGITLFEAYRPRQVVTFQILDQFYVFQNYSLTHRHHSVTKLSSSLQTIRSRFRNINFNNYLTIYPDLHESIEDFNSLLLVLSQDKLFHEQERQNLLMDNSATIGIDPTSIVNKIDKIFQNIFILFLSGIISPMFSTLLSVLFLISLCWSLFWTVMLFKMLLPAAISSARNKFTSRNSNVPETTQS